MTQDGERFDQALYDAVMAKAVAPENPMDPYQVGKDTGYMQAAQVAARIAAERDAIIEALAQEAETVYLSYNGYDDTFEFSASMRASVIDWLRSHQDAPPSH